MRVLVAFDQLVQAAANKGIPGETISARAGKAAARGRPWGCVLCRLLDWIEPGHCQGAIQHDRERAQAVLDDLKGY